MIRVNLLPYRATRKKENIRKQALIVFGCLVLILVGLGAFNMHLNGKIERLDGKIKKTQMELATYRKITREIEKIKKEIKNVNRMLGIISKLEKNRKEPVMLMEMMTEVIVPKRMWLTRMKYDNNRLDLYGNALDNKTVADFMTRIENTGYFKAVSLNSITHKEFKDYGIMIKMFKISCFKELPEEEPPKNKKKQRKIRKRK